MRSVLSIVAIALGTAASAQRATPPVRAGSFLDVGGVTLWYEECGDAGAKTNVVLLHDGLLDSSTWDAVWPLLCAHYRVVRYDRRGYGRSQPSNGRFAPEDDLDSVLAHVRMQRVVLVGNSSGAGLALDFAIAHPEMVSALIVIGPVVHGMPSSSYFYERGDRNNAPLSHGDVDAAARNWSHDRFLVFGDDSAARRALYQGLVRSPQNLSVAGGLEIRPSPPTVNRLGEIQAPTLIVVGEADIADVFAYAGAIEANVPVVKFEVWKSTGHMIQLQQPAQLVVRIDSFIPLATRKEVAVGERELGRFVGRYTCAPNLTVSTHLLHDRLTLEEPGLPYAYLFAASDTTFFLRTTSSAIAFEGASGSGGPVMVVHNSDGSVGRCPRAVAPPGS